MQIFRNLSSHCFWILIVSILAGCPGGSDAVQEGNEASNPGLNPLDPKPEPKPDQPLIYVAFDSTATQPDGKTWATAFLRVQDAVQAVKQMREAGNHSLVSIAVKKTGEKDAYRPDEDVNGPTFNRMVDDFKISSTVDLSHLDNVYLLGGFEGKVEGLSDRKPEFFKETRLSAAHKDSKGKWQHALHVVELVFKVDGAQTPKDILIDGFEIVDGFAAEQLPNPALPTVITDEAVRIWGEKMNKWIDSFGGGILLVNTGTGVRLRNLVIRNNIASFGGGLAALNSSPAMVDCQFEKNWTRTWGDGDVLDGNSKGGAIFLSMTEKVNILEPKPPKEYTVSKEPDVYQPATMKGANCLIQDNSSELGGGIFVQNASLTIDDCKFVGNKVQTYASNVGGGALAIHSKTRHKSKVHINKAHFENNLGAPPKDGSNELRGGAVMNIDADVFISDSDFVKNRVAGDKSKGGAIFVGRIFWQKSDDTTGDHGLVDLQNVRFRENDAPRGGAIEVQTGTLTAKQCTFTNNGNKDGLGGAIYAKGSKKGFNANIDLMQTTFDQNQGKEGGALYIGHDVALKLLNADAGLFNANTGKGSNSTIKGVYIKDKKLVVTQ